MKLTKEIMWKNRSENSRGGGGGNEGVGTALRSKEMYLMVIMF